MPYTKSFRNVYIMAWVQVFWQLVFSKPLLLLCLMYMRRRTNHLYILYRTTQKRKLVQLIEGGVPQRRESYTLNSAIGSHVIPVYSKTSRTTPQASVSPIFSAPLGSAHKPLSARRISNILPFASMTALSPFCVGNGRIKSFVRNSSISCINKAEAKVKSSSVIS